ncbi:MAG TPA: 16S rRNA (cytidine(1402)-2'-O)-methyltransferase [Acidiferrobacterales bacterium]
MSNLRGILYVVATPIGNLEDLSPRAARILREVDVIAAEDTRHSARLLQHFGIATPLVAFHEHNERVRTAELLEQLQAGRRIALISDAGTPLISDPGFPLVRAAREQGIVVSPVPGACAAIAALSASGLPSDRFVFAGFPPSTASARRAAFASLRDDARTLIFYESPHRIVASLEDMAAVFGADRPAVVARELTKQFETLHGDTLAALAAWVTADPDRLRGEFVVLVHGAPVQTGVDAESERVLRVLLAELPVKQAAALAAAITGRKKNALYELALRLKP